MRRRIRAEVLRRSVADRRDSAVPILSSPIGQLLVGRSTENACSCASLVAPPAAILELQLGQYARDRRTAVEIETATNNGTVYADGRCEYFVN